MDDKMKVTQTTKPGEAYIRLSNIIKKLQVGDKIPPYSQLLKELAITQRSLDMAYDRLKADGVLEVRKHRGVFVKRPYAGGTFLFVAAEDVFLAHNKGENLRLYFSELRKAINQKFPGSRLEILLTESPDTEGFEREPQLRKSIEDMSKQSRILGVFVSYEIFEEETKTLFNKKKIPFIDINGAILIINDAFYNIKTMVESLQAEGFKKIIVTGINYYIDKHFSSGYTESKKELADYFNKNPDVKYLTVPIEIGKGLNIAQYGINLVSKILDTQELPEAFVVLDDYFCQGLIMGAYMKGIWLEEQCRIVTIANQGIPIYSRNPQKITLLNYNWNIIAGAASDLMLNFMKETPVQLPVIVRPRLS
jgi:DNA-binding LacI/PurR family transcriptional regulator